MRGARALLGCNSVAFRSAKGRDSSLLTSSEIKHDLPTPAMVPNSKRSIQLALRSSIFRLPSLLRPVSGSKCAVSSGTTSPAADRILSTAAQALRLRADACHFGLGLFLCETDS